jgi:hypothetical protein
MEEEPSQPGSERRSSQRYTTRSLVEVRIPTWTALQAVYTVNLSLWGMRLSLGARTAMGAPVDIILTLPDGERIHLPGKVAYLGSSNGGDVGVRFDELPVYTQQQIQKYVDELAAGRTPKIRERVKSIPPGVLIKKKT